ncbi:MAG: hypothetical protein QOI66_5303 [Myxococcales bacterium]|nr:hypothetical protein [Myxococcales bacterium]
MMGAPATRISACMILPSGPGLTATTWAPNAVWYQSMAFAAWSSVSMGVTAVNPSGTDLFALAMTGASCPLT